MCEKSFDTAVGGKRQSMTDAIDVSLEQVEADIRLCEEYLSRDVLATTTTSGATSGSQSTRQLSVLSVAFCW